MQRVKWTLIRARASAGYISNAGKLRLPDNIHHVDRYWNYLRFNKLRSSFISSATKVFHGNLDLLFPACTHARWGIRNGYGIRSFAPCSATPALAAHSSFAQTKFTLPSFLFKLPIKPSECRLCFRCTVQAFVRVSTFWKWRLRMESHSGKITLAKTMPSEELEQNHRTRRNAAK